MSADSLWTALAMVLVIEGIMPLIAPGSWRRGFSQLLALRDGQLRFFGLCSVFAGLLVIWLLN